MLDQILHGDHFDGDEMGESCSTHGGMFHGLRGILHPTWNETIHVFPSGLSIKFMYAFVHSILAACPAHRLKSLLEFNIVTLLASLCEPW